MHFGLINQCKSMIGFDIVISYSFVDNFFIQKILIRSFNELRICDFSPASI